MSSEEYWCFACQQKVLTEVRDDNRYCVLCNSDFIEDLLEDHPEDFVVEGTSPPPPPRARFNFVFPPMLPLQNMDNLVMGPGGMIAPFQQIAEMIHASQQPPKKPTSKDFLSNLHVRDIRADDELEKCYVCQDDYVEGDEVVVLPCGHGYHRDCILPWCREHNTCPVCRYELPLEEQVEKPSPPPHFSYFS